MKHPPLWTACLASSLSLALPAITLAQPPSPSDTPPSAAPPESDTPTRSIGIITVQGVRPTSLPTRIPTTTHSATREDIARTVNAMDSEDALKYFPSMLVRKRYIGDYNHAILSSRASGTGNSARSVVYADGILLSNFLGNGVGGLSFPPRWGLVTPEEIERVDVMYGPFSAAYPGNSVGAVVDYVTRMPTKFEAHAKVGHVVQPFELYGTREAYRAWQASTSVGNRSGALSWWLNVNQTHSESQPQTYSTRTVSQGTGSGGTPVTGAVLDRNSSGEPWYILGAGTQYDTRQDHLKVKLAYDLASTLRASYVLGLWRNASDGNAQSYLRDVGGQPVYSGGIAIGSQHYTANSSTGGLRGNDFTVTRETLLHTMQGISLKRHARGEWDWEVAASQYAYRQDDKRQNSASNPQPGALAGGSGTLAQGDGTGWTTLALRGTWRPPQAQGRHVVDVGYQRDAYKLRYSVHNLTGNYLRDEASAGSLGSEVRGNTLLQSLYAQDTWQFAARWKSVLGLRVERWEAFDGLTDMTAAAPQRHASRHETALSPKAALSWQWRPDTVIKASLGRAVRMPTVHELYGATSGSSTNLNDPRLRPERSWTSELSAEQDLGHALARLTFFAEDTRDAIYSQTSVSGASTVTRVQNIGRVATFGLEAALNSENWLIDGLDLWGSLTFTDSTIRQNDGYVATPGDTIGKRQPNVPRWRATALASYRINPQWTASLGARHAAHQYRTLNNADVNGNTYMGVSKFFTVDVRLQWKLSKQWRAAVGIDNLNNARYWNFHPYPQRSYTAELSFDL